MEARVVLLGNSLLTSHSSLSLSQGKFNLSFAAHEEDELSLAASENGLEPSEADASTDQSSAGAKFPSEGR